jgi:ribosomal protein S5
VRAVLELAGVQNVLGKRLGSRSTLNNARVTLKVRALACARAAVAAAAEAAAATAACSLLVPSRCI